MATVFLVLPCWNTTWLHSLVCGKRVLFDGLACESASFWMILHVESVSHLSVFILVYYEHFIRVIVNGVVRANIRCNLLRCTRPFLLTPSLPCWVVTGSSDVVLLVGEAPLA